MKQKYRVLGSGGTRFEIFACWVLTNCHSNWHGVPVTGTRSAHRATRHEDTLRTLRVLLLQSNNKIASNRPIGFEPS